MPKRWRVLPAVLAVLFLVSPLGGCAPRRRAPTAAATDASRPTQTAHVIVVTSPPEPTQTPYVIVVTATPLPATVEPVPTATPVPTLPPSVPPVSDLEALMAYAEQVQPLIEAGLAAAERDGQILEAAEQDESAMCGGALNPHPTLVADAALMHDLVRQLDAIAPPPEAADSVHRPLRESANLAGEALDNINRSCQTANELERGLLRAGAVLQVWGAALNLRIAAENFTLLLIANGLEELAGR